MGEYHHSLDDKKRLIIPSKLREDLGDYVIVTRGLEDCLFIYSQSAWNDIVNKLKTLPFTKKDARSVNDRIEIWSKANWDNYFSNNKESMADVADHLFEVDL